MTAPAERLAPPEHRIAYPNVIAGGALEGEREYAADAVVVGTGAGGATTAARLRDAGLDVVMLEEGALHPTETFVTDPATMIRRLYRDAGTTMILGRPPRGIHAPIHLRRASRGRLLRGARARAAAGAARGARAAHRNTLRQAGI